MTVEVHNYHPNSDPDIARRLGRIEKALTHLIEGFERMTKVTDAAIAEIGDNVLGLTDAITAIGVLLDGAVTAQKDLADELESEGQDVTKLRALSASIAAQRDVLVAKTVAGTPVDPGTPIPDSDLTA